MQTRTHVPGQVLSQVARGSQQNGNAPNGTGLPWLRWQSEQDTGLRRHIVDHILQLFKNRKPHVTPEWQQKLPDFVKRLEEALYKNALSKDEYADLKTLEQRLQSVARRMVPKQQSNSVSSAAPVSNMIPTPGAASNMIPSLGNGGHMIQTPGSAASMIPTPGPTGSLLQSGIGVAVGLNNIMPTPGTNSVMNSMTHGTGTMIPTLGTSGNMGPIPGHTSLFNMSSSNIMATAGGSGPNYSSVSQQAIGSIRMSQNGPVLPGTVMAVGSQMIPTPGLNASQGLGMPPAASGTLGIPSVGSAHLQQHQQQQQFGVGTGNHIFSGMNGQLGGSLGSGGHQLRKSGVVNGEMNNGMLLSNGQHSMNGTTNLQSPPTYLSTSQYSSLQMQQQQQHQLQQHQLQQHQPQQPQRPQSLRMQSALPNPLAALTGDGYAMNAADLAGGSLSSGNLASNNLILASISNSPAPKMIPVPGLPSQQNLQHQQQANLQQQIQQRSNLQHQANNGLAPRNQQQQLGQLSNNQSLYQCQQSSGLGGQKQIVHDLSPQQPLSSQMQQTASDSQQFTRQNLSTSPQILTIQQQPQLQQQIWRQPPPPPQSPQAQRQQTAVQLPLNRLAKSALQQRPALNMIHQRQGQGGQQLLQQQQQQGSQQPQAVLLAQLQAQSQSQPQLHQLQRGSGGTETPLQSQAVQQQHAHLRQINQISQQGVGLGAPLQHPVLPGQLLQNQSTQSRQALGKIGSALSPPTITTSGLVGGAANGALPGGIIDPAGPGVDAQRQQQYSKQQRWLLFLRHASKCTAPEGLCQITPHCHMARQLWTHIASCRDRECTFSRCNASRTLLHHHQHCRDARCPVCGPVRQQVMNQQRLQANSLGAQQVGPAGASLNSISSGLVIQSVLSPNGVESSPICESPALEELDVQQPPPKRVKVETPSGSNLSLPVPSVYPSGPSNLGAIAAELAARSQSAILKFEQVESKSENAAGVGPAFVRVEQQVHTGVSVHRIQTAASSEPCGQVKSTEFRQQVQSAAVKAASYGGCVALPANSTLKGDSDCVGAITPASASTIISTKSGKPKNCGTSLTELFTPEQIQEHITGLRQWVGQSKAKAEKNQAMEHQMSENACRLCAVEKLTFEPPPIYCTACGARIKRNASYYTTGSGDTRHYFCVPCYNEVRSENVEMEGMVYPKLKLERKKNDEETEEAWVQCDKCNLWQHQVCALFNGRRNEGDSEYICPECCCVEMEKGERKSLPSSAVLGAKDLPKTFLSDHLEQRLTRKLKQERAERAKAQGKNVDEVSGAEALVVRVVSSVDKKLEVKQRFLEIFQEEDYPTEYPYRSKVVLLFQKIEGVEVCLFGMYVQEFGVESSLPNQRRVYLSYLDSVKYFRPDVRTANGEALRTFVYHEILIGYLDYCRKRGFSSCYIWACPPLKGEDYILYCHPEIQKTPKSDKLRDWYLTMLRKASNEEIVVEITNLYDHFFASVGDCKAKVTAARLPYFDGDYWPGAAEDMIVQLQQEEEDVRKNALKKGKTKKQPTKRFSKGLAQVELVSNASKDTQLMQKLGESIFPMKEDFIMVHMHHACTHCCLFIVSGRRWVCKQCKSFQLCDKCYDAEQRLDEKGRHPTNIKELHSFQPVEVNEVPSDTKDTDESMESEFFDTRQAFLSLCQGNHYQYDTLRRAKHSSMMVLYHLHNPTAPAFVVSCNVCHLDIETGNGWRCETCADFDLCNKCKDTANHPHKLAPFHDRTAQNKEARQQRVLQLRKMLELLVHASQCGVGTCQYPKCRSVKGLFRHGMNCRIRASGGCNMCKRMWYLLQLHARACKESECRVPRCKDLKEHLRRLNHQMESRRRVAVKEMMRQRAAEAAASNS